MQALPAGLLPGTNIEFFACANNGAYCLKDGRTLRVNEFDVQLMGIVLDDMQRNPQKVAGIEAMGLTGHFEKVNQYLVCNYGGFDNMPDVIGGIMQEKEYWPCPKRGNCPQEGIVCDGLLSDTGELITPTEIRVIKHIARGHLNKEIAHELGTKESTVATHTRNIRRKTGLSRKSDITRFAIKKHLI